MKTQSVYYANPARCGATPNLKGKTMVKLNGRAVELVKGQRNLTANQWVYLGSGRAPSQPAALRLAKFAKSIVATLPTPSLVALVMAVLGKQTADELEDRETKYLNTAGCRKEWGWLTIGMVQNGIVSRDSLVDFLAERNGHLPQALAITRQWPEVIDLALQAGIITERAFAPRANRGWIVE